MILIYSTTCSGLCWSFVWLISVWKLVHGVSSSKYCMTRRVIYMYMQSFFRARFRFQIHTVELPSVNIMNVRKWGSFCSSTSERFYIKIERHSWPQPSALEVIQAGLALQVTNGVAAPLNSRQPAFWRSSFALYVSSNDVHWNRKLYKVRIEQLISIPLNFSFIIPSSTSHSRKYGRPRWRTSGDTSFTYDADWQHVYLLHSA